VLLVYLSGRDDRDRCLQLWHAVLACIVQHPESIHSNLAALLQASYKEALPDFIKPKSNELDEPVENFLTELLNGSAMLGSMSLLSQILTTPGERRAWDIWFII
jgi:hypothetical protein